MWSRPSLHTIPLLGYLERVEPPTLPYDPLYEDRPPDTFEELLELSFLFS